MSAAMNKKGIIFVANYNQAIEIEKYLNECLKFFSPDQIIVVDDGSNDGSDHIAEKMGLRVLRHGKNRGIGAAIRTGIHYAQENDFKWILISSSNGKMVPAEFANVYGPVDKDEVQFTQGSRFLRSDTSQGLTLFRSFAIPVFSAIIRILLRARLTDVTCGLRAYDLDLLEHPSIDLDQEWLDRYEMEYYLLYKFVKVMRVKWIELPVTIRYSHLQKGRKSKIVPLTGWWSMIRPFVFLTLRIRK